MKLGFVVTNYKQDIALNKDLNLLILIYKKNRYFILFNDWENPNYFIFAFLILFWLNNRVHLTTFNSKKTAKIFS